MIVGNKEKFAIELQIINDSIDEWLSCRFYFWLKNMTVGDPKREMYVNDILIMMHSTYRDSNERQHIELFSLNTNDLYERLNNTFFGQYDTGYERIANDESWARFIVNPIEWQIYIIENDKKGRLLFKNPLDGEISEISLEKGEFDVVYGEMYQCLDNSFSRIKEDGAI